MRQRFAYFLRLMFGDNRPPSPRELQLIEAIADRLSQ